MVAKRRVLVAALVAFSVSFTPVCGQDDDPNADGNLLPEIRMILTDANSNGRPDILELPSGSYRPGFVGTDYLPAVDDCGLDFLDGAWDGLSDEPVNDLFAPDELCKDFEDRLRVPTNHGKVTVIYLLDSDGYIDPTEPNTDDSFLYVGIDICNAIPLEITGDLGTWRADYELPPGLSLCTYGLPSDPNQPSCLTNFMVPFDADGDGDPSAAIRLIGMPEDMLENYGFRVYACAERPVPCFHDPAEQELIDLELVTNYAARDRPLDLDPKVQLLLDGDHAPDPNAFPHWPRHGTTPSQIKAWGAAAFAGANPCEPNSVDPNLAILDVEFIIPRIDTYLDLAFPDTEYEVDRLRLAKGLLQTRSDANLDQSDEDIALVDWFIPIPQLEVTKHIRCECEPNDAWRVVADALPGSIVECKIEVENTGNVPLDVTFFDEVVSLCDAANLDPITFAIIERDDPNDPNDDVNISDTVASGDDIQVVPLGGDVCAGGVIILPGPDGVINSTPAGDDQLVTTTMSVTLHRTYVAIIDQLIGGNRVAESEVDPNDPNTPDTDDVQKIPLGGSAPAGCEIVLPGPDGLVQTWEGGDDQKLCEARESVPVIFSLDPKLNNVGCLGFDPVAFFGPFNNQFLVNMRNGVPSHLGTLNGFTICGPAQPALRDDDDDVHIEGDRVVIIFKAVVETGENFCDGCLGSTEDVQNKITAFVDQNENGLRDAGEVGDSADALDTPREIGQGFDDNVVTVDITGREVTLEKHVRRYPDGTFDQSAALPEGGPFPMEIEYRYRVTNGGEVAEDIVLIDGFLCEDVTAVAGVDLVPAACDLCQLDPNDPKIAEQIPAGQVREHTCRVVFSSQAALLNFMAQDDVSGHEACRCDVDPNECYRNCAAVTASVASVGNDVCGSAPAIESRSEAEIYLGICRLNVAKQVACIDECGGGIVEGKGYDDAPFEVVRGSAVRFKVTITNLATNLPLCGACKLTITDAMGPASNIVPCSDPNAKFYLNDVLCATVPPDFNVDGNAFDWLPSYCDAASFVPGDVLTYTFDAEITPDASCDDPNDAANSVTQVDGFIVCPVGNSAFDVIPPLPAEVTLDIKCVGLTCTKEWRAEWDSDADCEPGPGLVPGPDTDDYVNVLDLSDKVFPVFLFVRVTATNGSEIPLDVTAADQQLCDCVDATPGASFVGDCELCPPPWTTKRLEPAGDPNDTATWECQIRVATAAAMRAMALNTCDGGVNDDVFENTVTLSGIPLDVCPGNAVSGGCSATVIPPPPCEITVDKKVVCLDDCPTGGEPIGDPNDSVKAAPGSCVRFIIAVTNTGTVPVPRVRIKDELEDPGVFSDGTVAADIAGDDVTPCVSPKFDNALATGAWETYWFSAYDGQVACRTSPDPPWIDPNEVLTITFDAELGDDDLLNRVWIEAYSEVCVPNGLDDTPCATAGPASADVDVQVPAIECEKTVAVDYGDDATVDKGPDDELTLYEDPNSDPGFAFPMRLTYTYTATNTGEVPLTSVEICDELLVSAAVAVGATVENCALCSGDCDGTDDECTIVTGPIPPAPAPGSSIEVSCDIVIADLEQLLALLCQDDDPNACDYQLVNEATVTGIPDFGGGTICEPPAPGEVVSTCEAELRFVPQSVCTQTKAKFWIWNQNEVLFSGTERCIVGWNERLLTQWTDGDPPGAPNNFLIQFLLTDKGKARIDGVESTLCIPQSIDVPLLGVAARIIQIDNDPNDIALSAAPLVGAGTEAGQLIVLQLGAGPASVDDPDMSNPVGRSVAAERNTLPALPPPASDADASGQSVDVAARRGADDFDTNGMDRGSTSRATATQKGSLIIFPKVEIKWDAAGNLIQDTFLTLDNDWDQDVNVIALLVNGEPPGYPEVCHELVNAEFVLTGDEPAYWSLLTGQPKGLSPFTILGGGLPDPDPRNEGGTHLHGYVLAWAVGADNREIRWNHLSGSATIVDYVAGAAWEYSAWAFRGLSSSHGQPLSSPFGQLDLDGVEYDWAPSYLMLDFFAPGAVLMSPEGHRATVLDTDLTLWLGINDFTDE